MNRKESRRRFNQKLTLAAAAPLVAGLGSGNAPGGEPGPASGPGAEAQALTALVRLRFGKHLNENQLEAVRQTLRNDLSGLAELKRVRLQNGDEPDFVFQAGPFE